MLPQPKNVIDSERGLLTLVVTEGRMKQKPRTLCDLFYTVVERENEHVMLTKASGKWRPISSSELYKDVLGTARALQQWGIGRGDHVAILSENRPEWAIADFATLLVGAAVVPIYTTLTSEQILYVLHHSGARAIFVSTEKQLAKVEAILESTQLEHIIVMDEWPDTASSTSVVAMVPLMESGPLQRDEAFDAAAKALPRELLATLIYTSGTTGTPKGVMLTHGNLTSNLEVSLDQFEFSAGHTGISFLPLSHITARHLDYALFFHAVTIAYCPVIEELPMVLKEVHPTVFVGVPRVYEKIYNQVEREVGPRGMKRRLYNWALNVGRRHETEIASNRKPNTLAWKLANRLVFNKVREAMGGSVQFFISGGAPLGRELGEWYLKIGMPINEGYGLTETSPVIALNNPRAFRLGTVGRPLPNLQIRIAVDGEILVKGPSIFSGYWNMEMETRDAFEDGWFKTGDIGHIDGDGFLSITDRKKDLIKTSGGKFIAPQPIENSLKANVLVSEAAVVGERRRFPAVLIAPAFAHLEVWAQEHGVHFTDHAHLVADPRVQAAYGHIVAEMNKNLAQYEKLKKFILLPEELSVTNGTLTPTLKLRRRAVEQLYKAEIEKMYADATTPEPVKANS